MRVVWVNGYIIRCRTYGLKLAILFVSGGFGLQGDSQVVCALLVFTLCLCLITTGLDFYKFIPNDDG